jgi:hypothetical protein
MSFGAPDADGHQEIQVRYAVGGQSRSGVEGTDLGVGRTGEAFALGHGGSAWFGPAGDPFWGDAPALFAFIQGLAENQYRAELFTPTPANLLAGRNVTAIAAACTTTRSEPRCRCWPDTDSASPPRPTRWCPDSRT